MMSSSVLIVPSELFQKASPGALFDAHSIAPPGVPKLVCAVEET